MLPIFQRFKLVGSKSVHHLAMQRGEFELEDTALFQQKFQRSGVFVDAGANIGFYSCLATAVGKYVVAVEPVRKNLEHLLANVVANAQECRTSATLALLHSRWIKKYTDGTPQ